MKTRLAILGALAALSVAAPAQAHEPTQLLGGELTGNVALTSQYRFRGVTQSDENAALQGGFDYTHGLNEGSSYYLGVWGSNVDFNDGDEANIEIDAYGGVNFSLNTLDFTLGGIYYAYPGADGALDYDFFEVNAKVGHDFGFAYADIGTAFSPDFFGAGTDDAWYTQANVSVPLPKDFYAKGHYGYQYVDGAYDYADWSVGVGYTWEGFDFSVAYVDTDTDSTDCADGCDAAGVFTITKKF